MSICKTWYKIFQKIWYQCGTFCTFRICTIKWSMLQYLVERWGKCPLFSRQEYLRGHKHNTNFPKLQTYTTKYVYNDIYHPWHSTWDNNVSNLGTLHIDRPSCFVKTDNAFLKFSKLLWIILFIFYWEIRALWWDKKAIRAKLEVDHLWENYTDVIESETDQGHSDSQSFVYKVECEVWFRSGRKHIYWRSRWGAHIKRKLLSDIYKTFTTTFHLLFLQL